MNRKQVLIILSVFVTGLIATLISGLYISDLAPPGHIGADIAGYGFPFVWLKKIVIIYIGYPTRYEFYIENFLLDTLFWSLVVGIPIAVLFNFVKSRK